MLGKPLCAVLAVLLLCLTAGSLFAADIVTVPTANQLTAGQVDLAAYFIGVDQESLIPPLRGLEIDSVNVQTLYWGVTNWLELDLHRYDVDVPADGVSYVVNASVLVQPETAKLPAIVVGGRNLTHQEHVDASYYICTAKTLNPPVSGPPTGPIYRLHLSAGTEDLTLFGEERHQGLFGGLQVLVRPMYPQVGAVGLWDGQDFITGVTYTQSPEWPTLKAGSFGGHWWVGADYMYCFK